MTGLQTPYWLVTPSATLRRTDGELDRQALESLAGVGAQTFARLDLVAELGRQARTDLLTGLPNRLHVHRPARRGPARGERSPAGRRPVPGPGRLQVGQRPLRPRRGRRAAADRRRAADPGGRRPATAWPGSAATSSRCCSATSGTSAWSSSCAPTCWPRSAARPSSPVTASWSAPAWASCCPAVGTTRPRSCATPTWRCTAPRALGKSQYRLYEESLGADRILRLELIEALRTGIRDDLVVHYQPVVNLETGRIGGVEALVRWRRDGALVPPDLFIPAAEDSGLIVPLGQRVLQQVMADSAAAGRGGRRPHRPGGQHVRPPAARPDVRAGGAARPSRRSATPGWCWR